MRNGSRILLVDDDRGIQRIVARTLEDDGFDVVVAGTGAGAREALQQNEFTLLILDVNLPDANGFDLCKEFHKAYDVPIIMITVLADENDVIAALQAGADDYVRKPFGPDELVARAKAVLRRAVPEATHSQQDLAVGPLRLDSSRFTALIQDHPLALTPVEYRLLACLAQNVGRVLTHDQLLRFVWGEGYEGEYHMLRVALSRLRQKLGTAAGTTVEIRTMQGVGYELIAQQAAA